MDSIAIAAFTRHGCALAARLAAGLVGMPPYAGADISLHAPRRVVQAVRAGAAAVAWTSPFARAEGEGPRDARPMGNARGEDAASGRGTGLAGPSFADARPFDDLAAWTAARFADCDALVFVGAAGIAVRAIAPHVADKLSDPAVVAVDEAGRFAVPLLSGHVGGANDLARMTARLLGGRAAISTATDVNGVFAVDQWAARHGLRLEERELAKEISARLLEGGAVGCAVEGRLAVPGLPEGGSPEHAPAHGEDAPAHGEDAPAEAGDAALPAGGVSRAGDGAAAAAFPPPAPGVVPLGSGACPRDLGFAVCLDEAWNPFARTLHLVPRVVTVGVGCRKGVDPTTLARAVDAALAQARVSPRAVRALATIDVKRGEPAIGRLAAERGWELRFHPAAELAAVPGAFSESAFVEQAVGVGNVCERAAVAGGGILLLGKRAGAGVTVAIGATPWDAYAPSPDAAPAGGWLAVVGLGPGGGADLTGRARAALAACDLVVGYPAYVDLVRGEFPGKEVATTPMRAEVERCRLALARAAAGRRVALVCSGDPGVYGMAAPVLELAGEYPGVDVRIVPGVTAAMGGAALLGAPLGHDWCVVSLSDLLTPWEAIERRLAAAARADFALVLYNPASHRRPDHLRRACDILLAHKDPDCVCGLVRNVGRAGQEARVLTLGELRRAPADMFTTAFVGSSRTRAVDGKMVTPRGYRLDAPEGCAASGDAAPGGGRNPGRRGASATEACVSGGAGSAMDDDVRGAEPPARAAGGGLPGNAEGDAPRVAPRDGAADAPRILLFGGTTEGRRLAEWLDARGRSRVVCCCATEYGAGLVAGLPRVRVLAGRLDEAAMDGLVRENAFACIVDATHPFATRVSENLARVARARGVPLLRVVRAEAAPPPDMPAGGCVLASDLAGAARLAAARPGNILLTTGTHGLEAFARAVDGFADRLFVRTLPAAEAIAKARALGIPAAHVVAMQGPFSAELNAAIMRQLDISTIVTKASGAAGGFAQKLQAAQACGALAIVVGRPRAERGFSLEAAQRELEVRYGA